MTKIVVKVTRKQFINIKGSITEKGRHILHARTIGGSHPAGARLRIAHHFDADMALDIMVAQRFLGFHILVPPITKE